MVLCLLSDILGSWADGDWQQMGFLNREEECDKFCGKNNDVFKPQHLLREAHSFLNYGLYSYHAASFSLSSQFPDRDLLSWCQNQPVQMNLRNSHQDRNYWVWRDVIPLPKCFWQTSGKALCDANDHNGARVAGMTISVRLLYMWWSF